MIFAFFGILLFFCSHGVKAIETFSRDSQHRGIIDVAPYQIYPENRLGNGIYLNKKLLDSHPQRVILNITKIKNTESYVYLFRSQNDVLGLDIVKSEADGDARFWKVDTEFYQYTNNTFGIQRVFRIFNDKVIPLLSNLRTGAGVKTSKDHAIFYHITGSKDVKIINSSGQELNQRAYTFRLHLVHRNREKIRSLKNIEIQDFSYNLKLEWVNEYSVSYNLSSGKKEIIDLRKQVPSFF